MKRYSTFNEFWPFYLKEHSKTGTKVMHFLGTTCFLILLEEAIRRSSGWFLLAGVIVAYAFAWIGHFAIEKNKPATFQYPLFSLIGDFKMYGLMWMGKIRETSCDAISGAEKTRESGI
ncbi:MAG: DUF962 domain-containing protein [Acidobacteria bacterium]|nr:MAG: DUF962 domain-containing protein [Acidobacteriota bacterium]